MAALMAPDLNIINEDGGAVIDGAEVQQETIGVRRDEPASVPDGVMEIRPADARERRLVGEGDQDRAVEGRLVKSEAPFTVEVDPVAPT